MPVVTTVRGRTRSGPHVFIAIPCHGEISAATFSAFFEGAQLLDAAGYTITLCTEAGNCHVDDARNSLVREFLKSDATEFVFIDADVGFPPENLLAILAPDRDIVAGIYPKKDDNQDFPILTLPGEMWTDSEGLIEVEGVPTGFLRIKRKVLECLRDRAESFIGQAGDDTPYHVIFERLIAGNQRRSGDYAFCWKARQAGFRIWCAPEMDFTHTGEKTWAGRLGKFWKDRSGITALERARKLDSALRALIAGKPGAQTFHDLTEGWGNGYSATPEMLADIWTRCSGRVLECGSGLSTIVLAARGCDVTSLEHDPMFASHIQAVLDRYGLEANVECKPLVDRWYDFDGGSFDCLVVDGPPRAMGDRARVTEKVTAPLVIWDDYAGGLDAPEIVEVAEHRYAIWKEAA